MSLRKCNRVEFPTHDGLLLRGDFYPAAGSATTTKTPSVIMTQGLALLKEHYLCNWAERFTQAGFSVLAYDHRNFGHSQGVPRNEVDLALQADDYSDAVSYMMTLESVDPGKIFLWGIGHSGGCAATAAARDRRIAGVILVMPSQSGRYDWDNWPAHLRTRHATARAQGRAEAVKQADFWRFWPVSDLDRNGHGESMLSDDVAYHWAEGVFRLTAEGKNTFDNKVMISSLHSIYNARPGAFFREISPTPVLLLAATDDPVASAFEDQLGIFEQMGQPKEFAKLTGHHLANYFGEQFEIGVRAMIEWLKKYS
ncbi:hypothetical protein HIM_00337 [Hirsutella minnesotensis 3608]|nr:hypothetical protein HIM_00337 [Hirsutella minnesotensis 3608]